jgi:hypothetical protein
MGVGVSKPELPKFKNSILSHRQYDEKWLH